MPEVVHLRRPAMATWFEAWLVGDDSEHLAAVGEAALDEVTRIEGLLSRFDPAAEIARVNRSAAREPVMVDRELFAILEDCLRWHEVTEGYFNPCVASLAPLQDALRLNSQRRTVALSLPNVALDIGAYGKGYALDAAARQLTDFGIVAALIHGGTSSVLARGFHPSGEPWRIGLRNPFAETDDAPFAEIALTDAALSHSAVFGAGQSKSDIIDPTTQERLSHQAACVVIASSATQAEALSTALLAMGKARAAEYLERMGDKLGAGLSAGWIESTEAGPEVHWLVQAAP